jgi:hypothetical protein
MIQLLALPVLLAAGCAAQPNASTTAARSATSATAWRVIPVGNDGTAVLLNSNSGDTWVWYSATGNQNWSKINR